MKQFKKNKSKLLAMLMTLMMVISMIPASAFAEPIDASDAPFTATVDGTVITDIDESIITWTGWGGGDYTCYTVTVPEGSEEATLVFEEEKEWSYYDSKGNYVGAGDTSWMSATEHKVAIQDSNSDGELDGISVQVPGAYSTEFYIMFKYAGEGSDEPETPVHKHDYDEGVITTEPTCNEPGVRTFTCDGCNEGTEGHSYTEEVAKTGHKYDEGVITTEPTCASEGVKTYTCQNTWCKDTDDGHTKTEKVGKVAHTYDKGVVDPEPTCTEPGVKTFTCSVCPEETEGHTKTETIPAVGHQRGEDTECDVCGDVAPEKDENGVYQIGTAKEMLWFAKTVNNGETGISGKLTKDIDLSDIEDWPGIGVSGKEFAGSFDGQNHVIKLNGSSWGVIGYAKGTEANHVQIKNIITEGSVKNSAIAQTVTYVDVDNCINRAAVGDGNSSNIAGIVGNVKPITYWRGDGAANITNCTNEGNVIGSGYVGGILGYSQNHTKVICCNNSGNISGNNDTGGIVGYLQQFKGTCKVENSYNIGKVSGNSATGGIVGNLYNGAQIINCYNAGESTYAITGNIYNNTVTLANTYYSGDLCSASVANITQTAGYFTGDRGTAVTSAEMSGKEIADTLGDAFQQSCPSPVFTWQEANVHSEDIVCEICKQGSGRPTEYKVVFDAIAGSEIVGDTTFRAGNNYSFKVNILDGYYAADDFSVYVNNNKVDADEDGVYAVEQPNGPFYISIKGVKEYEGILPIVLPGTGEGFRVNPCDGYESTVESGKEYKFTVDFVEGFKAGKDFVVKVNNEEVKPDADGVYTIENIKVKQTITVAGVDIVPSGDTVTIDVEITKGSDEFLVAEETEAVIVDKQLEIPYFDLELYDYEKYYYNPYCYVDKDGNINGQQKVGTRETAYDVVTSMHAFIYMTEVYYLGYDPEDAGTGYSDTVDSDNDGKSDFDEAVSWGQGVGSTFMNLWGLGSNLNYHLNYEYPIGYVGWGSTSDQQALKDGDRLSVHMITGSASGSGFGLFVVNDDNGNYDRTDIRDRFTVNQGDEIKLTHYVADQGSNYTTSFVKVANKQLYWIEEGEETANIKEWNYTENDEGDGTYADFGNIAATDFRIDENGEIVIDTSSIEPGTYYIGAEGGFTQGTGKPGADGFVSRGAESGPAYFKLIVEESSAAKLAEAKNAAKEEIAGYKNASDYREAQQAELATAIEEANAAIDAAETVEAVEEAVATAKVEIDKIKTDAQLDKEEADALAKAKEDAKTFIVDYKTEKEAGGYGYSSEQLTKLQEVIANAETAIDKAETIEAVEEAKAAAIAEMDTIKTLKEEVSDLSEELENAKKENEANKEAFEKKIADLEAALKEADAADKAAMQEAIKSLQDALKAAEEDSAAKQKELAGQIEQLQKDIADAKALTDKQKEELSSEITSLKTALDASDAEKQAMQEEIDALKAELEQLKENKQLAAPTGVKAFNNTVTGKNRVSWKAVAGAEEYAVYRSTSKNGAYRKMFTTTGTTYTNTSAKAGTLYYYKVKALTGDKSVDDSKFSAVVKRTCDLKKPVVTAKSPAKKQVKLTWKKVSGAKKYAVYRATSKNGKYTKIATTKKLSYTNKKLKSGKTYYYKVKAIAKNSAANSAFSTVDKCKSR
ncbi:MAG: hypothetical protein IKM63_02885 [Firmicutes bacterium]|nr:hypothetical protein [Bacillota bacterium]